MAANILSLGGIFTNAGALEARLGRLKDDQLRHSVTLLCRATENLLDQLQRYPEELKAVQRRLLKYRLYLLVYIKDASKNSLFSLDETGLNRVDAQIPEVRQIELMGLLEKHWDAAIFDQSPSHHFVAPSGFHVQKFLRLTNAITNFDEAEQLSSWILDDISWADAVVVDTWGLSSVPMSALMRLGKPQYLIRSIEAYDQALRQRIRQVIDDVSQNRFLKNVLFINSVCSSGGMQKAIDEVLEENSGLINGKQVFLYAFSDSPLRNEALCVIPEPQRLSAPSSCVLCLENHSKVIDIHQKDYAVRNVNEISEMIKIDDCAELPKLAKAYPDFGSALFLHRDDPNDRQHHAFYVDFLALMKLPQFKEKYIQKLKSKIVESAVAVIPPHPRGDLIEEIVREEGITKVIRHKDLRLDGSLVPSDIQKLRDTNHVLVLDDISLTGSRLQNYHQSLREGHSEFGTFEKIDYLVGFSRPPDLPYWEKIRSGMIGKHKAGVSVESVETVVLPHWNEKLCPWCLEYEQLSRIARLESTPEEWIQKRIDHLASKETGILSSCICLPLDVSEPVAGSESQIAQAGASLREVLFAFASGLQVARTTRKLGSVYPDRVVLHPTNLTTRYTENMFRLAIFRASRQEDWSALGRKELMKMFLDEAGKQHGSFLSLEILVHAMKCFLPLTENEQELKRLISSSCGIHAVAFIKELGLE